MTDYASSFDELTQGFITDGQPDVTEDEIVAARTDLEAELAGRTSDDGITELLVDVLRDPEALEAYTRSMKRSEIVRGMLESEGLFPVEQYED